ncbi:MAG TPA: hypothetical protein VKY45_02935 [Marinilabiliaceae bacterium]|nr:hypothetical protein [Marinilabiliaceae bacterium]
MKLRAKLIELWSRVTPLKETEGYFANGGDDNYSKEIEKVIDNSPTAKRASDALYSFIKGKRLSTDIDFDDNNSLSDVVRNMASDIAYQGGVWVHRSIKIDTEGHFVTANLKVLDYHKCRKGKKDDNDFDGRVYYVDQKEGSFFSKSKTKWFYAFSDNQEVIKAQIISDAKDYEKETLEEALESYRGQVIYINTTPKYVYALSPFDAVFNDMDTEYRISLYANRMFRSGFLGKTMVMFSGLSEEDSENLEKNVTGWLGAENTDNVYIAEVDNAEDVSKSLFFKQLDSQYDDDMSQNTEKRITRNILGAAKNLPEALIFTNDNAMFGSSGEMITQLKSFYNSQTEDYRTIIEKNLARLGFNTQIEEL